MDPVPVAISATLADPAAARADPAAALEALAGVIRAHRGCGFEPCETCLHPVPGEGSPTAELMVIGEAPGAREAVFIANVLKARPPGNRDPRPAEVAHHRPWLDLQLAIVRPRILVPLGRHALKHFAPEAKISEVHGRLLEHDGRELYPMYHPAAALHNQRLRETLLADARGLRAALGGSRAETLTP